MAVPALPAPNAAAPAESGSAETPRSGPSTSPVAVVWCRQVDNEAESPGYTTVPEEFPGHRETLETIRIVGNLTVNVADTHDYWDPDPAQPLSYYPNIFLYPANAGRYTCVGRMFLSTEDRPRLGMKTVVLDTAQLLATNEFGATVLRWHASMGGARQAGRLPPVPDPSLYSVIGEGFLFQRGTTDPVVVVASEQWEPAVQTILELIRVMPASLIAPAAFLAFPYFLPAAKTDLKEFAEQLPLGLAVMRVARGEAAGERHAKRISAWEAATTVRDLTDGIPASAKGKESAPLVLQYVRDHNDARIRPISQRVDLVELPRLRQRLSDPERSSGRDRRKEMWRIGTAMESAALLLAKSRGRHVSVSTETAKRAQEYLQARLPASTLSGAESPLGMTGPATAASASETSEVGATSTHPPWLQRNETVAPLRVDRIEVVPISHSDDPSLLPSAARPVDPANVPQPPVPSTVPPGATPATPSFRSIEPPTGVSLDPVAFRAELERTVARWVETRIAQIAQPPPAPSPTALGEEIDRRAAKAVEARLAQLPPPVDAATLEARYQSLLDQRIREATAEILQRAHDLLDQTETRLDGRIDARTLSAGQSQADLMTGVRSEIDGRLTELSRFQEAAVSSATAPLTDRLTEIVDRQERTDRRLVEIGLMGTKTSEELQRLATVTSSNARELGGLESRIGEALRDSLPKEIAQQLPAAIEARLAQEIDRRTEELRMQIAAAEEELRRGLTSQIGAQLLQSADRESGLQQRLETRLSETVKRQLADLDLRRERDVKEIETRLNALLEARSREIEGRIPTTLLAPQSKLPGLIEARVADAELRLATRQEARSAELRESQLAAGADLQVRLQTYLDQRIAESSDRQRTTSIELLARMKSEVDGLLGGIAESPALREAVRSQVALSVDAERSARERTVEERVRQSEAKIRSEFLAAVQRLEALEQLLEARGKELREIEVGVRSDLSEVDRRTAILSDRLVPVVRKTWLKIGELEKGGGDPESDARWTQLRREFQRDLRKMEAEMAARDSALRDRMETAIANQGRVWLTLIRQLTTLTGDRRGLVAVPEAEEEEPAEEAPPPGAPSELDDLPELLKSRRRGEPELAEEERPGRPRRRTSSRAPGA